MSNIEPTEEQRGAALRFCKDHSVCGNGWLVDEFTVAELLAEREAKLREEVDANIRLRVAAEDRTRLLQGLANTARSEADTLQARVAKMQEELEGCRRPPKQSSTGSPRGKRETHDDD